MVDKSEVREVTEILVNEYCGIGATSQTALESLADDLANNRLDVEMLECSETALLVSLGNLLKKISELGVAERLQASGDWQEQVLKEYNGPTEDDWWFAIR